ncbi:phage tail protein [Serratia silvae]|uniref:Phage tail protein n=1 Tax=Serratia silvae TaxID=2824122 RepID=A0ABT0KH82_9GAMM|nr:phage tail protein [Serratia silvae]MCL1031385.1 phage tail protein [Serratia silvae]
MNKIPYAIGTAAGTAVAPIDASATIGSFSGGSSVFAGLVFSKKGKPNTVLGITPNNGKSVLGEAPRPQEGPFFEPLRHVNQALSGGNGYVVRVPFPGMMIPAIHLTADTTGTPAVTTVKASTSATAFGADITVPTKAAMTIYVDDGDKSENRKLSLEPIKTKPGFFALKLMETDSLGAVTTIESYEVSFKIDAIDDMSLSAFLPDVLERNNSCLRALASETAVLPETFTSISQAFVGGSDGDFKKLTTKDYSASIAVLDGSIVDYTAILTLGIYDAVAIAQLADLAKAVRVDMFADVDPRLPADKALAQLAALGLGGNENVTAYYYPYSCRDPLGQSNVVFGLSGDAFTAKAKGVAMVPDIGGWHFSPAGKDRGVINRQNIKPLPAAANIDREVFAKAHLNVVTSSGGVIFIDDALTTCAEDNYKKYQHVVSVMNSIARNYYALASSIKHSPDGITREGLEKGMTRLLDRYYAAEALRKPRDPDQGDVPYILTVTNTDFDSWQTRWEVCVVGVARRIVGIPVLLR